MIGARAQGRGGVGRMRLNHEGTKSRRGQRLSYEKSGIAPFPSSILHLPSSYSSSSPSCLRAFVVNSFLHPVDLAFLLCHQGIELGKFHSVAALFFFAEAENVGFVLRAPAVEIEAVFLDRELADLFEAVVPRSGWEAELARDC